MVRRFIKRIEVKKSSLNVENTFRGLLQKMEGMDTLDVTSDVVERQAAPKNIPIPWILT